MLYAFDATKLGPPLYTSEQNSQRDRAALATRFAIPIVVKGHVYFSARGEVEVYGLLKSPFSTPLTSATPDSCAWKILVLWEFKDGQGLACLSSSGSGGHSQKWWK